MSSDPTPSSPEPTTPQLDSSIKQDFKSILERLLKFLKALLDIRHDADAKNTISGIKKDIPFQGHTAWILIFSIFIASIGLNTNSTAVVIGAMLISPLMGPILGIGLAIGINDIDTLRRSLVNFGVMVLLSVLTAFIYFKISPFRFPSTEIISRTEPTILDVLIAIFGGLAGIVAWSRKEKSNAIPGVAIATALMPPLCTAGFGLAIGNFEFFFGALYLFGINTVFIALSTFVVVKYLRFPLAKYATASRRKKVNRMVGIVALVVIIPSVFSFVRILDRTLYEREANFFLDNTIQFEGTEIIKQSIDIENQAIEVYLVGDIVPNIVIENWKKSLEKTERLLNTKLTIRQGEDKTDKIATELSSKVKEGVLKDLYIEIREQVKTKESEITQLKKQIEQLKNTHTEKQLPLLELTKEIKIHYPELETLSYAKVVKTDAKVLDTVPTFSMKWQPETSSSYKETSLEKLKSWLELRLKLDKVTLMNLQ